LCSFFFADSSRFPLLDQLDEEALIVTNLDHRILPSSYLTLLSSSQTSPSPSSPSSSSSSSSFSFSSSSSSSFSSPSPSPSPSTPPSQLVSPSFSLPLSSYFLSTVTTVKEMAIGGKNGVLIAGMFTDPVAGYENIVFGDIGIDLGEWEGKSLQMILDY
jgi:hypothetical protein